MEVMLLAAILGSFGGMWWRLGRMEGRLTATRAGYLDNLSAGAVALEATLTTMKQTASGTFDRDTDSLEALRDRGDAAWVTKGAEFDIGM